MILKGPICVALDQRDPDEVARVATAVERHVGLFKVGLTTFVAFGSYLTRSLAEQRPVFLDLKLHDIPAQVAGAVASLGETGASLVTIHAAGGRAMVQAATEAAAGSVDVLAVTVLTSLDDDSLDEIGLAGPVHDAVLRLSDVALDAGVTGLVCSPLEVAALRERYGSRDSGGPLLVVPGIRPPGVETADQLRTMTPGEAMQAGADVLVVGRPITTASDPQHAAAAIEDAALKGGSE